MKKIISFLVIFLNLSFFIFSEEYNSHSLLNFTYIGPSVTKKDFLIPGMGISFANVFYNTSFSGIKNNAILYWGNKEVVRECRNSNMNISNSFTLYDSLSFAFKQECGNFLFTESAGLFFSYTILNQDLTVQNANIRYIENNFSFGLPVAIDALFFINDILGLDISVEFPMTIIAYSLGTYNTIKQTDFSANPIISIGFCYRQNETNLFAR